MKEMPVTTTTVDKVIMFFTFSKGSLGFNSQYKSSFVE